MKRKVLIVISLAIMMLASMAVISYADDGQEYDSSKLDGITEAMNRHMASSGTAREYGPTGNNEIARVKDGDVIHFPSNIQTRKWYYKYDDYEGNLWAKDYYAQVFCEDVNYFQKRAKSTDDNVAYIADGGESGEHWIGIVRYGAGSCKIRYWGEDGVRHEINVIVDQVPYELSVSSYTFDSDHSPEMVDIDSKYDSLDAAVYSARSSNTDVVITNTSSVIPCGVGSATVTCTSMDGRKADVSVKVKKGYFSAYNRKSLKGTYVGDSGSIGVKCAPGTKLILKYNGKTYKYTVNKTGFKLINKKLKAKKTVTLVAKKCGTTVRVTKKVKGW